MYSIRSKKSRHRHRVLHSTAIATALLLTARISGAADIALFDWGIFLDGTTYCALGPCDSVGALPGDLPPSVDASLFDFGTGLGEIAISMNGAGSHQVSLFLDLEIDEPLNTFFNEWGDATGLPAAGQTWEIDEPGYVFGDIYDNWLAGSLDGTSDVPSADLDDDVSFAIAWDFLLSPGMAASVSFLVSETVPSSGFYLTQTDPDSDASIYFSSRLHTFTPGVPEPFTAPLLIGALVGLVVARTRPKKVL